MKLAELLIADIQRDAEASRKVLERVPLGKDHWKPHEKSMELGPLVYMVTVMVEWVDFIVNRDELDVAPKDGGNFARPDLSTTPKILEAHTAAVQKAVNALKNTTEEHLHTRWKLLAKGKIMMEGERHVMIRDTVLSHLAHHRGQLTVYLRLLGASVPAIYGPSADEGREIYS
jgi:uncharacterized damage-inducible protein DinB